MAKGKKAKKGKTRPCMCLHCGRGMKKRQAACKCGWVRPAVAARPGAVGGNVVPIAKAAGARTCWAGHGPGKRGARCCVTCGEPYGIGYGDHLARTFKSARAGAAGRDALIAEWRDSYIPEIREGAWRALHPEFYDENGNGRPA